MAKRIYVIGHKNPDTDSVVSAAAYAGLKRALGFAECRAARAGGINPQTEYIFERFGVEIPEFLPDLVPRVEFYLNDPPATVDGRTPLWEALALMGDQPEKAISIVDAEGRYRSTLHYGAFAQNVLKKINPHKKAIIPTSVGHLAKTLKAQPVALFDESTFFKAHVLVGALESESFKRHLDAEQRESAVVVVGDREDIQRYAIESKVRAVIVTNGALPGRGIKELAEANRVSLLVSPFDTSSTSILVIYSTPVETMGDAAIRPVSPQDHVRTIRAELVRSPCRSLPVVDAEGRVVGVFAESDLAREPNVDVILVDHNEYSQAVDGIESYRVLEVVDHHRIGSFQTRQPISFINRPVGSTSTIVAGMYREAKVPIPRPIASILLCGILSDTLILRSATTTDVDRDAAEYLANIADLEIDALGRDIMSSAGSIGDRPAEEIVRLDLKEYRASGASFSVSQVEVTDMDEVVCRKEAIFLALKASRKEGGRFFSALMATDVTELSSVLFIDADKDFLAQIPYPRMETGMYALKDILSRKKQLLPVLLELVERAMK